MMDIGLSCWNRWGEILDRADNSDEPIVANIVNRLVSKGHTVHGMQVLEDPDPTFGGDDALWRETAFRSMRHTTDLPHLDVLFVRWRWKIPGYPERDCLVSRQDAILDRYLGTETRVIIFDDDFQLFHQPSKHDVLDRLARAGNVELVEVSDAAKDETTLGGCRLTAIPYQLDMDVAAALTRVVTPSRYDRLAYVGNRYERDDVIDTWVSHETTAHPSLTHFYGNWGKTDSRTRWPDIEFHQKVGRAGRDDAYRRAVAVPMLAKQVYLDRGHVVPRLHEVVHAGGIPIGLSSFRNASRYFAIVAEDGRHLSELVDEIWDWSLARRKAALEEQCAQMASEFDTGIFIERLEL